MDARQAIILAAGRGSRMGDLTQDRPKCLLPLRGRPLLDWQIEALTEGGISNIAIVTGYKHEALSPWGLREFHNPRWSETNMVYSLTQASAALESEVSLVSYSDIFYQPSIVAALRTCEADIAISYDVNWYDLWVKRFGDPLLDAETFRLNPDNTVAEIGNRPRSVDDIQGQYMGLLRFTPTGWGHMHRLYQDLPPEQRQSIHMTGLLQKVIDHGAVAVQAVPYEGSWGEADNESDISFYNNTKEV